MLPDIHRRASNRTHWIAVMTVVAQPVRVLVQRLELVGCMCALAVKVDAGADREFLVSRADDGAEGYCCDDCVSLVRGVENIRFTAHFSSPLPHPAPERMVARTQRPCHLRQQECPAPPLHPENSPEGSISHRGTSAHSSSFAFVHLPDPASQTCTTPLFPTQYSSQGTGCSQNCSRCFQCVSRSRE
jgi:hypothetical protein